MCAESAHIPWRKKHFIRNKSRFVGQLIFSGYAFRPNFLMSCWLRFCKQQGAMPARILVVDDDISYLMATRDLLECGGHEVLLASTFDEGRRALREEAPDLLIADVRLGAFNGLQLIVGSDQRVPSIVISGFDDAVLQADARACGADYLVKPVAASLLLCLIEQKLARSSASVHGES